MIKKLLPILVLTLAPAALSLALLLPATAGGNTGPVTTGLDPSDVRVSFAGLQSSDGYLVIMLYDDPAAFASYSEHAAAFAAVPARPDAAISFQGLPEGSYAIRAFHDEDGDGDLAMDNGYPLEGYATSGANGRFDDPDFTDAITTSNESVLTLYYLN